MQMPAELHHSRGLPIFTHRVKYVAALAIKRKKDDLVVGQGKVS